MERHSTIMPLLSAIRTASFLLLKFPRELALKLGAKVENHPLFPNRTNVQFLKVLDRNRIRIEIWEEVPDTPWLGSSSSAAGAVARKWERVIRTSP